MFESALMPRVLAVLAIIELGCDVGTWHSEREERRVTQDVCAMSSSFDVVAHGTLRAIGASSSRRFSAWPNSTCRLTAVELEIDEALRGPIGTMKAVISAPAEGNELAAPGRIAVGAEGWFSGIFLDGEVLLSSDGFTTPKEDGSLQFPYLPRFDSAAHLRSEFRAVEARCPRVDLITPR